MKANIEVEEVIKQTPVQKAQAIIKEQGRWKGFCSLVNLGWYVFHTDPKVKRIRKNGIKVDRKSIVLEDAGGDFARSDIGILFAYLLQNGYNRKYRISVVTARPEYFQKYKKIRNVRIYRRRTKNEEHVCFQTFKLEASAGYVFFTDRCTVTSTKKDDQVYILLDPSCNVLKQNKADGVGIVLDYAILSQKALCYTKSEYFDWMEEHMLPLGRPCYDVLLDQFLPDGEKQMADLKKKKRILWVPMSRTADQLKAYQDPMSLLIGLPGLTDVRDLHKLDDFCAEQNVELYVDAVINGVASACINKEWKALHFVSQMDYNYFNIVANMDAFIVDYGVEVFDFLLLHKPMAYMLRDEKEMQRIEGFAFSDLKQVMPGQHLYNIEDVQAFICAVAKKEDPYQKERDVLYQSMPQSKQYCKDILDRFQIKL